MPIYYRKGQHQKKIRPGCFLQDNRKLKEPRYPPALTIEQAEEHRICLQCFYDGKPHVHHWRKFHKGHAMCKSCRRMLIHRNKTSKEKKAQTEHQKRSIENGYTGYE